jgi:hypothetical protein
MSLRYVPFAPPPPSQRRQRNASFAGEGEKQNRYHLPALLDSGSPVGFRSRLSLRADEAQQLLTLSSLPAPAGFAPPALVSEQCLFEESSLSVLLARQSTNFRGWRDVVVHGADATKAAHALRAIGVNHVLDNATHCHLVWSRPYRTPFTQLLTFVGHRPVLSVLGVPLRAWRKYAHHHDDIPTIGWLQHLHLGILAESFDRAAILASRGAARANVHMIHADEDAPSAVRAAHQQLEALVGIGREQRRQGWRVSLVAQVGMARADERVELNNDTAVRLGAALLALRSERIQPGVNHEDKAPDAYRHRQDMDVADDLLDACGAALYDAFAQRAGCTREQAKQLVLLDRVDVLTERGKTRLRQIRAEMESIADKIIDNIPLWADLPLGRALTRNAARGKKAFALTGQRIYIGGVSERAAKAIHMPMTTAVRAFGAAAARSALVAEVSGTADIPEGCDLLGGVCLMAGPVNQNDVGKQFFGVPDLLSDAHPQAQPTSLLVWTLKAKTVADPIGNEEQLLNAARKGALVDLRPAPHEVVFVRHGSVLAPMRKRAGKTNQERAFAAAGNFVCDSSGTDIPGNRGVAWPSPWSSADAFAPTEENA